MRKACLLAIGLLVVALCLGSALGSVGLGISHYDPHIILVVGEEQTVPVAMLFSVGDEPLYVDGLWRQTNGTLELPVELNESTVRLEANSQTEISIKITVPANASFIGNYSGEVDLGGRYVNAPDGGSPVVPGGTAKVWVCVVEAEKTAESVNFVPWLLAGVFSIVPFVGVSALVIMTRRRKTEMAHSSEAEEPA